MESTALRVDRMQVVEVLKVLVSNRTDAVAIHFWGQERRWQEEQGWAGEGGGVGGWRGGGFLARGTSISDTRGKVGKQVGFRNFLGRTKPL